MITYEVVARSEPPLAADYEDYMRRVHVPAVLATGCFVGAIFERTAEGLFRMRYQAGSQEALDRYLQDHTSRLREEITARFPTGITFSRAIWSKLEQWG
jgi:hypothetical protein